MTRITWNKALEIWKEIFLVQHFIIAYAHGRCWYAVLWQNTTAYSGVLPDYDVFY